MITGTIINISTVLLGSLIGILFRSKLPERFIKIVFQGIGLFTLVLGVAMALKSNHLLVMVFSLIIGGILGELLRLENRVENIANQLKNKFKIGSERFSEGMITAFLLYCMGSMTILGAIEEGLGNGFDLLLTKSIMDGFASIALASAFGTGVAFSVVPLLVYQGGLTVLTAFLGDYFSEVITNDMTAVGGVLLVGLGINILEIKKIKVLNLLPAILAAIGLSWLYMQF
ncbi:DUF554 domain-containing protein [Plebeiibacterium sediminum]|uniref:DUF554 domain-containing protein n=1 Tax=Plebeiibacterium sediminum TaxID=2992112 RepID=A0AAE3SEP3_9BACT|nr:DUF554 domain-containing protein [Plebeiobacterium sediminum]MCW3785343.1 DUF554 domain-containing protein [Plebeiobacterium sediminum]